MLRWKLGEDLRFQPGVVQLQKALACFGGSWCGNERLGLDPVTDRRIAGHRPFQQHLVALFLQIQVGVRAPAIPAG